ncbi:MAG TPA: hypothetical protein VIX37_24315 [Candidatus Sulfotelmatobacter sp.]
MTRLRWRLQWAILAALAASAPGPKLGFAPTPSPYKRLKQAMASTTCNR